jgi:hypothetical protein
MSAELPFHPLANLFPLMEGTEFDELVASIRDNGLREPVIIHQGMILDGRNRYRACRAAGIAPRLETFGLGDPVAYVIDKNVHRRHLNESQRAFVAAALSNLKAGDNQHHSEVTQIQVTTARAAALLNVGKESVILARKVLAEGTPEEIAAVRAGTARVSTVGKSLRDKEPAKKRTARIADPHARRTETRQIYAQMWGHLRDGLEQLGHLPLPGDVVKAARGRDGGLIDRRLDKTIQWLQEFRDAWQHASSNARSRAQAEPEQLDPDQLDPDPNA